MAEASYIPYPKHRDSIVYYDSIYCNCHKIEHQQELYMTTKYHIPARRSKLDVICFPLLILDLIHLIFSSFCPSLFFTLMYLNWLKIWRVCLGLKGSILLFSFEILFGQSDMKQEQEWEVNIRTKINLRQLWLSHYWVIEEGDLMFNISIFYLHW